MSSHATCPYCQTPLSVTENPSGQPIVCPHCLSNVDNPRLAPAAEAPNLLRDIRRNGKSVSLLLAAMFGLCCTAISIIWYFSQSSEFNAVSIFGFMATFGVLDVVVLVAAARPVWRYFVSSQQRANVDGVIQAVFLIVVLAVAIFAFFFTVCFRLASKAHR
jgi:hypothetical protein